MHSYSVEPKDQRALTIFFLAAAAIFISVAVNELINQNEFLKIAFEEYRLFTGVPTVLVFFAFYYIYDKWIWGLLWKIGVYRSFGIGVPDIRGYWPVTLESSQSKYDTPLTGNLFIEQRWTKIDIRLITDIGKSRSLSASVDVSSVNVRPSEIKLVNQYIAEPLPSVTTGGIQKHEGTNKLFLTLIDGSVTDINGEWYTERGLGGHGAISLKDT